MCAKRVAFAGLVLGVLSLVIAPDDALAQGNGKSKRTTSVATATVGGTSVTLTSDMKLQIREFYAGTRVADVEALPPGIRMRLARGKPLPPGIAKKVAPASLRSRLRLPDGYRVLEVGVDVLLVEVATNVIHDVLRDAIVD
jgi:hypothetical protein